MLFVPRQVALAASSSRPPAAAAAAAGAAMAKEESKKEKKSKGKGKSKAVATAAAPDVRAVVVASVAAFLEAAGFPRALAELQAEANLEAGAWKSSAVSLEDLVSKFLESSAAPPSVTVASNEQAEDASKKKKDNGIELNGTGNDMTASSAVQVEDETGEKKKKKKKKGATEASEPETKAVEPPTEEKPAENVGAETKEKKHRKKKKDKDESSAGEAKETMKGDDQKVDGKKKSKKQEGDDDDIEARLDKASLAIEKKKEKKLASEVSEKTDTGTAAAKAIGKSGAVETAKDDNDKKAKKKRKKFGSEENGQVDGKQADDNGSVPKPDNESKSGMEIEEGANGKPSGDNVVVSKKRKLEDVKGSDTPATENGTANQNVSNGSIEDDSKENGTASKPSKRQKMSNEPKSVTPFQRVKLDAVKFADERLQDNSYWAKGGAEIGYGAKAQEVLGQVRGRGFRHEKTKKKRGTYRGGHIDLGTHSIKFNNSDDEE